MNNIRTGEYAGLRLVDLMAKMAKVSRRDIIKVLATVNVCSDFLQLPASAFLELPQEWRTATTEPVGINYGMCERAYNDVMNGCDAESKKVFDALR